MRSAHPGQVVGYKITLRSNGAASARRLRVCDRPPGGLVLISARGTRIRNGRACWSIRALAPGNRRVLRLNARVEARNAATRSAAAPLRVGPVRQGPCAASAARAC